jgi:hypothetical protein
LASLLDPSTIRPRRDGDAGCVKPVQAVGRAALVLVPRVGVLGVRGGGLGLGVGARLRGAATLLGW